MRSVWLLIYLCPQRVYATGKAIATRVIQEREQRLNLANLSDRQKEGILGASVVSEDIFDTALTQMQKRCEAKKKDFV